MARRGALEAGAARASGERARRRSTPLIGAEPVTVAAADALAERAVPSATPKPAKAKPRAKAKVAEPTTATAKRPKPEPARARATQAEPAAEAATSTSAPRADEPPATPTPPRRRPHRPAPKVTSAPSRKVTAVSGERPRSGRRATPREKALRDAAAPRPHLRIAEPPLDPTVSDAPTRSGLPLPDLADTLEALVTALRVAAGAAGVAPEDVEHRVAQVLAYLRRRVEGRYTVDDYGYDEDFTTNVFYPVLRPLYRHWFRVEVRGVENIPTSGGALVVSNHSGTVAFDSLMIQLAIHDEHPEKRLMRALGADFVFQTPFVGTIARRSGSTLATNADAERLLTDGELVGVFPEGFKGIGKPFSERYKLQRFGRGGFVSAALRARVPIIPCSVVGAEEIAPIIGNMGTLARLLGVPYMPVTPTWPWLGPLGLVPLPSKWIIEFGAPIHTDGYESGAADDPMLVFDLTDQVRETIQQTLYSLLMQRRSVFF
ncbi:MAG TPA: lysophospholipid acyltransferase family protein [Phycicoccus sp.]